MSLSAHPPRVLLLPFAAALFAACDNPNPGAGLGTFSVTSALTADSCGGTAAVGSPGNFDVTLSNDNGTVYWFPSTGGTSTSGSLSASRTVSIYEAVADNVDSVDGGNGPCTLERDDTLSFTLTAGSAPSGFTGSYAFTVSAVAGTRCADQLTANGGGYGALPCTVRYALTGARQL